MPDIERAEAAPTSPPALAEEDERKPYYDAIKLADRIGYAKISAESKRKAYGDTTPEERAAALKVAASALKGTCSPPDIDAILRKIDAISVDLNTLAAQLQKPSKTPMKSMAFHVAVVTEGLVVNMIASGLYEILKHHWSFLMTLTMSDVKDSPAAIAAAENHARVTEKMPKNAVGGVLPDLDPIAYRMLLRQIRSNHELDGLLKSTHPINAKMITRRLLLDLSTLIASDGRI